MKGYLGESEPVRIITGAEAAMVYIARYGGIDGGHHKQWVLDQVARILMGTPVIVTMARWEGGHEEERYRTGEPSPAYKAWVTDMKAGEDGPETYGYDEGIAP